jgi:hypothetical protein
MRLALLLAAKYAQRYALRAARTRQKKKTVGRTNGRTDVISGPELIRWESIEDKRARAHTLGDY